MKIPDMYYLPIWQKQAFSKRIFLAKLPKASLKSAFLRLFFDKIQRIDAKNSRFARKNKLFSYKNKMMFFQKYNYKLKKHNDVF